MFSAMHLIKAFILLILIWCFHQYALDINVQILVS